MRKLIYALLCVVFLFSCTKEDRFVLNQKNYTMTANSTDVIKAEGLPNDALWISNNEYAASAIGSTLSSEKVGTANLSYDGETISVSVEPMYTMYTEPYMVWGSSISSIKSKYGNPYSGDDDILIYRTNNSASPYVLYSFTNGKLDGSAIVVPMIYSDQLVDFLGERYVFYSVDMSNYTADFAHFYGTKDNPKIDYIGRMAYDSSIGGVLILYVQSSADTRTYVETEYVNKISNVLCNIGMSL